MDFTKKVYDDNMAMVYDLAMKYSHNWNMFEDMVQEGMIGLNNACEDFNPHLGVSFSTYAHHKISGQMRNYRSRKSNLIHIPFDKRNTTNVVVENIEDVEVITNPDDHLSFDFKTVLNLLNDDDKQLIQLRFNEDLTYPEIANKTGLGEAAVVYRLRRILKQLKGYLD